MSGTMATLANFETVVTRLPDGVPGAIRICERWGRAVVLVVDDRLSATERLESVERLSATAARLLLEMAA